MNLSEHFKLEELCKTKTGIENVPNEAQVENLKRLCRGYPLRRDGTGVAVCSNLARHQRPKPRGLRRTADRTEAQRHLDSLRRPSLGQPPPHKLQTLNKAKRAASTRRAALFVFEHKKVRRLLVLKKLFVSLQLVCGYTWRELPKLAFDHEEIMSDAINFYAIKYQKMN